MRRTRVVIDLWLATRIVISLLLVTPIVMLLGYAILRHMLINAVLNNNDSTTARRIVTMFPFLVDTTYNNDDIWKIPMLVGAVGARNKATVSMLVSHGAKIDARNQCEETPLMVAAEWGNVGIIRMLLSHGANPNARNNRGMTPLHYGIEESNDSAVLVLLQAGADPNVRDNYGSLLMHAVDIGSKSLVDLLRRHGAKDPVSIFESAAFGDIAAVRKRLRAAPSLLAAKGMHQMAPLDYAAQNGQLGVVRLLLQKGARISKLTVLCGVDSRSVAVVEQLLAHGGRLNPTRSTLDPTPLYRAIGNGDLAMVRYLVEKGADVRTRQGWQTPMEYAQYEDRQEIASYLRTVIQQERK